MTTIFLAGAAGAVGRPLSLRLVRAGYRVVGTTRSSERAAWLRSVGVEPAMVDVYDRPALTAVVAAAAPAVVIHQLTDLPQVYDPSTLEIALARNARIRDEGTRNLVAAAVTAGALRIVAQSIAFSVSYALEAFERQILEASIEGVVLRYGRFWGPGTWTDVPPASGPTLHIDAAAAAAEQAIAGLSPGRYLVSDADGVRRA